MTVRQFLGRFSEVFLLYDNNKGGLVDEEIISDFQKRSWPVVP